MLNHMRSCQINTLACTNIGSQTEAVNHWVIPEDILGLIWWFNNNLYNYTTKWSIMPDNKPTNVRTVKVKRIAMLLTPNSHSVWGPCFCLLADSVVLNATLTDTRSACSITSMLLNLATLLPHYCSLYMQYSYPYDSMCAKWFRMHGKTRQGNVTIQRKVIMLVY